MSKVGPEFKQHAKDIISYIASNDPEEIAEKLEKDGQVTVGEVAFTKEHVTTESELVSQTGEVVDILRTEEFDILLEVQQ